MPNNAVNVTPSGFTGPYARVGRLLYSGAPLNAPISAVLVPYEGHYVIGNTGDNNMVDIDYAGHLIGTRLVDSGAAGAIFGMVFTGTSKTNAKIYFNDDNDNTLKVLSGP